MPAFHSATTSFHTSTTISSHSRNDLPEKAAEDFRAATATPPDGGRPAWLTIAGAWMVQFCTFGYLNAFGVYQDFYTRQFLSHESPSDISWIGSVQLFLMYAPGVLVGHTFDAGYFHHVQIAGSILLVFSIFMLSLTQQDHYYQVFLAQGLGVGLGVGMLFIPSLSIVSHHFRKRRALATGIAVSGASCGGIVFPIMLNHLFAMSTFGFANGVRTSGAVIAALLAIANCIMRTRLPPKGRTLRDTFNVKVIRHIVSDGAYTWSALGAFCTNLGLFVPFFYLQLFAADHSVNATVTTYILAILNAGSTLGRTIPVALADKLGVYNMLLPAMAASAALIFSLFGATTTPGVIVVAVLFGFSSGAYVSLIPPMLGLLSPDLSELGLRMGLAFSLVGISMLVGTPIFGALLGTGGSAGGPLVWWKALVFAGVSTSSRVPLRSLPHPLSCPTAVRLRTPTTPA
ncbi:MFS general substrate transporter [Lentinus tigrinus ALCF2SS1-7]|uniref:MFS general substrate transporter n=1 Tax=Lentinus tigrinus ALCF2SS1-6 TaxID=1328759 RepID=A0A5C2RX75_9APHY|nr:MFS general substrate transporter [Lentinus tigrinus ALCF2SS1-6]RPD70640.1 MFS general substrate transporter [Lentinus tigrinus ALCF2SS1-7]